MVKAVHRRASLFWPLSDHIRIFSKRYLDLGTRGRSFFTGTRKKEKKIPKKCKILGKLEFLETLFSKMFLQVLFTSRSNCNKKELYLLQVRILLFFSGNRDIY